MRKLTMENINKNQVDTIAQFKILQYLKKELSIYDFEVFLYNKNTIKVVDTNYQSGYFWYDSNIQMVKFSDRKEEDLEKEL